MHAFIRSSLLFLTFLQGIWPCYNGGYYSSVLGGCQCIAPFTGRMCDSYCAPVQESCTCGPAFTGSFCETALPGMIKYFDIEATKQNAELNVWVQLAKELCPDGLARRELDIILANSYGENVTLTLDPDCKADVITNSTLFMTVPSDAGYMRAWRNYGASLHLRNEAGGYTPPELSKTSFWSMEDYPVAPIEVVAQMSDSNQALVNLTWSVPESDCNGMITAFNISQYNDSGVLEATYLLNQPFNCLQQHSFNYLIPYNCISSNISFSVQAQNSMGWSNHSILMTHSDISCKAGYTKIVVATVSAAVATVLLVVAAAIGLYVHARRKYPKLNRKEAVRKTLTGLCTCRGSNMESNVEDLSEPSEVEGLLPSSTSSNTPADAGRWDMIKMNLRNQCCFSTSRIEYSTPAPPEGEHPDPS